MNITKDEFIRYEEVRANGRTNMLMINNVCVLSGLEREKAIYIMKHYEELMKNIQR